MAKPMSSPVAKPAPNANQTNSGVDTSVGAGSEGWEVTVDSTREAELVGTDADAAVGAGIDRSVTRGSATVGRDMVAKEAGVVTGVSELADGSELLLGGAGGGLSKWMVPSSGTRSVVLRIRL